MELRHKSALICTIILLSHSVLYAQLDTTYLRNRQFHLQTQLHGVYTTPAASIVMLGNSITQGPRWQELLGRPDVVNRGISGDITDGFLARISTIVKLKPKVCFVMGGINDLFNDLPIEYISRNMAAILDTLMAHGITPVLQSTLRVSSPWRRAELMNPLVPELNERYQHLARERNIRYLDLNRVLAPAGVLKENFTYDGVHLTAAAYAVWAKEVLSVLNEMGI